MPAPAHYRLTFEGIFGAVAAPAEIWSCSVSLGPGATFLTRTDMESSVAAFHPAGDLLIALTNAAVRHTSTRVAAIEADGKTGREVSGALIQAESPVDNAGGSGSVDKPHQIALCWTWVTALDEPTGRGRVFVPGPQTGTLDGDGRISVTNQNAQIAAAQQFVQAVNTIAAAEGYGPMVVAGAGQPSKGIAPGLRPVTAVRVGRVLDTQRRRRGELLEQYVDAPV